MLFKAQGLAQRLQVFVNPPSLLSACFVDLRTLGDDRLRHGRALDRAVRQKSQNHACLLGFRISDDKSWDLEMPG